MRALMWYFPGMAKPFLLCIGHRGAMGHEPENTLCSIRRALELGTPCIEIDVYWVDGHLMVFHDDRLERTTDGTGLISEKSFEALRSLDAGKGERIPTLEEVCELVDGKAGINVELKGPDTAEPVAQIVLSLIEKGWDKNALLASSFNHRELFNMRRLDPDLQLGVITRSATPEDLDFAKSIAAFSIHPAHQFIHPKLVKDLHARGIRIYAYTVNEPDDIARMHELGIDGVFTNYPERVLDRYTQGDNLGFWPGRYDNAGPDQR